MDWYQCSYCDAEFRVVSDSDDNINYCPHCGTDIDERDDDIDDDLDDNELWTDD